MSPNNDLSRLSVEQFAKRFQDEMIPLSNKFSYFFAALPLAEDDVREYLQEPIAALPKAIAESLPKISVVLVPYLERTNGRTTRNGDIACVEKPPENRQTPSSQVSTGGREVLVFAVKDQEVAEYHYHFYAAIAQLAADRASEEVLSQFHGLLREELNGGVHGEVDEASWHLKQALLRRQTKVRRETKAFRDYARQSLVDTLTLYLHGICCDIDVETGPRQLPSRYLRKRLLLLHSLFPPPEGYAVFPEDLHVTRA